MCLLTALIADQFYSSVSSQTVHDSRIQRRDILSLKTQKNKLFSEV